MPAKALIIAAPRSGSGKTAITLGVARALAERGRAVAPAKTGPDYIDPAFLAAAAGSPAINLDPWAMPPAMLRGLAKAHGKGHDLVLIEGVMGLFDGAISGGGSTADLAATLALPVILVIDCERQAQSVGALARGFATWREDVRVAGVVLNKVASDRHETMLRAAIGETGLPVLGVIPRRADLELPARHLGLVLPGDIEGIEDYLARAGAVAETHINFELLDAIAEPLDGSGTMQALPPLGQTIAVAHDAAFAFAYPHILSGWHEAGASIRLFSPLADEPVPGDADAIFLPGGYPELHAETLGHAKKFTPSLRAAKDSGALIYGECGGFMVLGETLADRDGKVHPMSGLLPVHSRIDRPKRVLGYRRLTHASPLPWPERLNGHEFHYSSAGPSGLPVLFEARDAAGEALAPMGVQSGRVMGSYAHVIAGETFR
ncbi:cobyrinate a,c-diamide synthase [Pelagibacterium sediminicola]|uniref:cobyrinate a,c-diamide synthase n=1 Tax=Pelagibacterium sediminicola TaxID=2248761 RepID=UPI000E313A89|nr:cobyrinate a,c-diamide synthase [Pelagibacterium sediminicola]